MIVLLLVLAHVVADFLLQSDYLAKGKSKPKVLAAFLSLHGVSVGLALIVYAAMNSISPLRLFVAWILILFSRGVLEALKLKISTRVQKSNPHPSLEGINLSEKVPDFLRNWKLALFIGDHLLHMIAIILISWLFLRFDVSTAAHTLLIKLHLLQGQAVSLTTTERGLSFLFILFLVTVVSGHLISLIAPKPSTTDFEYYEGKLTYESESPQTSFFQGAKRLDVDQLYVKLNNPQISRGKTIGYLERLIVMTLIFAGQYSAIAFIVTAKSLFRFKQLNHREWAEYFLVGTLSSVVLGMGCGLLLRMILL